MTVTTKDMTRPSLLKEADFVQSLARGLVVIRSFDADHRQQTLSEVARRTGLNRATVRRLLLTLADLGYVTLSAGYSHCRLQSSSWVMPISRRSGSEPLLSRTWRHWRSR